MGTREKSALYPNVAWDECLDFIKTIDAFKLKSVSYIEVAKKYNLSSVSTKSFTSKISASKQFGLITTSNGNTIHLSDKAMRLLYPTGNELRSLELECFSTPPLYEKLISIYNGKAIPQESILGNILMSEHKITRTVKDFAARCFIESATQLNLIQGGVLCFTNNSASSLKNEEEDKVSKDFSKEEISVHETTKDISDSNYSDITSRDEHETLSIPLGQRRNALVYMPVDATVEDAEYVKAMIDMMFKRLYISRE